jgi:hypothetical protein
MKIKILAIIILVFLSSIVWADEYVLVMNKDDNVCQHMIKLYNDDLKKYGEIKYDQHKEFNAIEWENRNYLFSFDGKTKFKRPVLISKFDINNDGLIEIIILDKKQTLRGIDSDALYIFKDKAIDYNKNNIMINENFSNKAIGEWGKASNRKPFHFGKYFLQEIPPQHKLPRLGNKRKEPISITLNGFFYFNPFIYDKVFYVAMTEWDRHQRETEKLLVVIKLNSDNQIKDVCYFQNKMTKHLKKK